MGPDGLDMKIEVKRLSRESRRQAEGEREEKEKDREKRQTDIISRGEGRQRKNRKSSFSVATLASSALQILQSLANVAQELRSSFICFMLSVPKMIFLFFSLPPHIFFPLLVSIKCQVNFLGGMSYTLPCAVCVRGLCVSVHMCMCLCVVESGGRGKE